MKHKTSIATTTCPNTLAGRFRTACAARLLMLMLLLTLAATGQAQDYTYTTNNGTITITGYTGSGGAVTIPSTINGLPVTIIGDSAFQYADLTSVTIPDSVTSIGDSAFFRCSLTSVTIGNSVTSIGDWAFTGSSLTGVTIGSIVTNIGNRAFNNCTSLTTITVDALNSFYRSVAGVLFNKSQTTLIQWPGGKAGSYTIPNSVTSIGDWAFSGSSLTSVTIPDSVTSIGDYAFSYCYVLTGVYFQGKAPSLGLSVFDGDYQATVYYLPGTTGWSSPFGGCPAVLWNPQAQTSGASFGVRTNRFGFNITGSSNLVIVVESCTNLANPVWQPVQTNTLTGGSSYFSDPQWTNYPARLYRLRSP